MKILAKRLGKGEIGWGGVVIPRAKRPLFPPPVIQFDLLDGKRRYTANMDNYSRLRMATWFRQHRTVKAGDEVAFFKENGKMRIALSRNFSKPERETFDWAQEVIEAVREGEVRGILRIRKDGFSVEMGDHIKETQVVVGTNQ